eukprot:3351343-Rhodomonas_salina.1
MLLRHATILCCYTTLWYHAMLCCYTMPLRYGTNLLYGSSDRVHLVAPYAISVPHTAYDARSEIAMRPYVA